MTTLAENPTPSKWAFRISHILNAALGDDHFPIKVTDVAKELSLQLFPDEPVVFVKGESLPGFEGGLLHGSKGWGIIYNSDIRSDGRINFTLAHEFGHYLLHRLDYPGGIQCSTQDLLRWESAYRQIEYQANQFAANLLMPLDDYRRQIPPSSKVTIDMIDGVASRYGVSFMAALLRWIEYTEQRAVMVVSRDDFILWARSSKRAHRTGAYFKTVGVPPVPIPRISLAANKSSIDQETAAKGKKFKEGIWLKEPCEELTIFSDQYDFVVSLILLDREPAYRHFNESSREKDLNNF